jgi:thiol-disulfide isomerase/thioredoxin
MSSPINKLCALAALFAGLGLATTVSAALKVGDPLPDLTRFDLGGALPATAGKVVVIDFWASWCAPCKAAFPAYDELHRDFAAQGLVVLGVGVDEKRAAHDAFLAKLKPVFATVHDGAQKLVAAAGVPGMPTAFIVDRRGIVRHVQVGYHGDKTRQELRTQVAALLAEKP